MNAMRHENLSSQKKGVALVFGQNAGKASGMFFFSLEICIFKLEIYISRLKIQIFRSNLRFAVRPTAKRFLLPLQSYQHALVVAGPRALRFDDGILRSFISPLSANDGSFRTKNGGFHRPDTGALVENKVDAVPFIRFGCLGQLADLRIFIRSHPSKAGVCHRAGIDRAVSVVVAGFVQQPCGSPRHNEPVMVVQVLCIRLPVHP